MSAAIEKMNGATLPRPPRLADARLAEARSRLAEANRQVEKAGAEVTALAEPCNRLAALAGAADRAEKRRAALAAADDARLGAWLASGEGDRPAPSPELIEVERELIGLRRDQEAAEKAAPPAQERFNTAAARLRDISLGRDQALYQAAAEVAIGFIAGELRQCVNAALAARVKVESLIDALTLGPIGQNGGARAAERIRESLVPVLRTAVPRDIDAAGDFLRRLITDPMVVEL
ncbi:MAG TPA: hypothetical protein VGF34_04765 [Stellaceae bacterium]|jgi:hypothetical protein